MVVDAVKAGHYSRIQQVGRRSLRYRSAPSKIPGAALTFNTDPSLGEVGSADLDIATATAHAQPWSPMPSTTTSAPELRTQTLTGLAPDKRLAGSSAVKRYVAHDAV